MSEGDHGVGQSKQDSEPLGFGEMEDLWGETGRKDARQRGQAPAHSEGAVDTLSYQV